MYLEHYRLHVKPFEIEPDPKFLWMGQKHKDALATLRQVMLENERIFFVMGESGTGKSMFLSGAAHFLGHLFQFATISDPSLSANDFFKRVANAFGIQNSFISREDVFSRLRQFLHDTALAGRKTVLLIDDAQWLSSEVLRQLRLLANLKKDEGFLIHTVLAGQYEFDRLLPANRVSNPTVAMSYMLQPLTESETAEYISHRLHVAGSETEIFTASAMAEIFHLSGGIPRLINIISENALLSGYARNTSIIGAAIISDSEGPGHRLIHEICKLDKELAAQQPLQLPSPRGGAVPAAGTPPLKQKRPPGAISRFWQSLLETLGLKPLTVKGALAVPTSLFIVLGFFVHFYFRSEDDTLFTQVQIHSEQGPGRQTIPHTETLFKVPSGTKEVTPAAEIQENEGRSERHPGLAIPSNEDRLSVHEINQLRDQLRSLLQQLQTSLHAIAQLEQGLKSLEKDFQLEKGSRDKLIAEVSSKESEILELRMSFEIYKSRQRALEEDVKKVTDDNTRLQAQLEDLKTQTAVETPSEKSMPRVSSKATVSRPKKGGAAQPAPASITNFLIKEKMQ